MKETQQKKKVDKGQLSKQNKNSLWRELKKEIISMQTVLLEGLIIEKILRFKK